MISFRISEFKIFGDRFYDELMENAMGYAIDGTKMYWKLHYHHIMYMHLYPSKVLADEIQLIGFEYSFFVSVWWG